MAARLTRRGAGRIVAGSGGGAAGVVALQLLALVAATLPLGRGVLDLPGLAALDYGARAVGEVPPLNPPGFPGLPPDDPGAKPPEDPSPGGDDGTPLNQRIEAHTPAGANDNFQDATEVPAPSYTDHTDPTLATREAGEPLPSCGSIEHTVWYRYQTPERLLLFVDTLGSNFDTRVAVWEGSDLSDLREVDCNDNASGQRTASRLAFIAEPGTLYRIQVGSATVIPPLATSSTATPLVVNVDASPVPPDDKANQRVIGALPFNEMTNNEDASTEPDEKPSCFTRLGKGGLPSDYERTLWYQFTARRRGYVTFSTFGSDTDTVVLASGSESTCSDDEMGTPWSRLTLSVVPGDSYLFQVGTIKGLPAGDILVSLTWEIASTSKSQPTEVLGLPFRSRAVATATNGTSNGSGRCGGMSSESWYRFVPLQDMSVWAQGSSSDAAAIEAFDGRAFPALRSIACSTRGSGNSSDFDLAALAIKLHRGVPYFFRAGALKKDGVSLIDVTLRRTDPPLGDDRAHPIDLTSRHEAVIGVRTSTVWATVEDDEPADPNCPTFAASLWFRLPPPAGDPFGVSVRPDSGADSKGFATALTVWEERGNTLRFVHCRQRSGLVGEPAPDVILPGEGRSYLVQAGGINVEGMSARGGICLVVTPAAGTPANCPPGSWQPEGTRRSEPVVPVTYGFEPTGLGNGFAIKNQGTAGVITWDPARGRALLVGDRTDPNDHLYARTLDRPIESGSDFRVAATWGTDVQGNHQMAIPLYLGGRSTIDARRDLFSLCVLYHSRDMNVGTSPEYAIFFNDSLKQHVLLDVTLPTNTVFQVLFEYRARTSLLSAAILGPSGIELDRASLVLSTPAAKAGIRFSEIGMASVGHHTEGSQTPDTPIVAWVDDIGIAR